MIIAGYEDLGEIPEEGSKVRGESKHLGEFGGTVTQVFLAMDTPCLKVSSSDRELYVFPEWDTVEVVR